MEFRRDDSTRHLNLIVVASFGKALKTFQAVERLAVFGYGEAARSERSLRPEATGATRWQSSGREVGRWLLAPALLESQGGSGEGQPVGSDPSQNRVTGTGPRSTRRHSAVALESERQNQTQRSRPWEIERARPAWQAQARSV
jgi:hypothetical protein